MVHKKGLIGVVAVAILIALVIAGYFVFIGGSLGEVTTKLESGDEMVTAAEGRVVSKFPRGLFLEPNAPVSKSYSIKYSEEGVTQPVLEYESAQTLAENIELYGNYLFSNGWQISHVATTGEAPVTYFYATKGDEQINVTFSESPEYKVSVTIAYSVKKG